jgi:uncharacterized UBP type Zn finger protein
MPTFADSGADHTGRPCDHISAIRPVEPDANSCQECLARGAMWNELWLCLSCGWVSSWRPSSGPHTADHYTETDHPIAAPLTGAPGVRWCFADQRFV